MPKPRTKKANPFAAFLEETDPNPPSSNPKARRHEAEQFDLAVSPVDLSTAKRVANVFPRIPPTTYRIALIGEAPGEREEDSGIPFVGPSGYHLNTKLSQAGILRDQCFVGNICQIRPPGNDVSLWTLNGPQITEGLEQLAKDLDQFNPHICVLLGKTALLAASGVASIGDWRGSLFLGNRPPFFRRKCIATYHPAACLRQYEWTPLLLFDLKKALRHATTNELLLPQRQLHTNPGYNELLHKLDNILLLQDGETRTISCDIEGYVGDVSCISIAASPDTSFIVPFTRMDGSSYWSVDEETQVWRRLAAILADKRIKKIWQNGLYDRFVLQYGDGLVINGNAEDTMLKFWELYCELEKGLGFQCSVLGDEPFYKSESDTNSAEQFFRYCCKDSACTFENSLRLDRLLAQPQKDHYYRNNILLNPIMYMELRGINYDLKLATERAREIERQIHETQVDLDFISGRGFGAKTKQQLLDSVREIMLYKNGSGKVLKKFEWAYDWAMRTLSKPGELTKAEVGQLSAECKVHLNVDSYPQVRQYLYVELGLPEQLQKKKRKSDEDKVTSDYAAMLKLKKGVDKGSIADKSLDYLIDLGQLSTRLTVLQTKTDPDGRVRCGYNLVGTETARLACYKSPTGSGFNFQTATKGFPLRPEGHPLRLGMRDLFLADPGCYLFECDLSGADGWTVGAMLNYLGDPTMLDDLRAGIKPAQVVCYLLRHGNHSLSGLSRDEIKLKLKEVKKEDWDYFACKQGIWGLCYTMGPDLLAVVIAKKSGGTVWMDRTQIGQFQSAVFSRYRIELWHNHSTREIKREPVLTAFNGFRRRFFGRPQEILGQYLAHLPQVITTHATNSAIYNLWTDPDNRLSGDKLRVEPLHQVHDALIGQFRIGDTDWAINKIKSWFANEVVIAGQRITIPYEGAYGHNWALDSKSKVGDI